MRTITISLLVAVAGFVVYALAVGLPPNRPAAPTATEDGAESAARLSATEIVQALRSWRDKNLNELIYALEKRAHSRTFTNDEIDPMIEELVRIERDDPYQVEARESKSPRPSATTRLFYANRVAAARAIVPLEFHKIVNNVRMLPMQERVVALIEHIEQRTIIHGSDVSAWFENELVDAGPDAVPFIVAHEPRIPAFRRTYVSVLGRIGDQWAIDYIVRVLADREGSDFLTRAQAAEALGAFHDDRATAALIDALSDGAVETVDRCLGQVPDPKHIPCKGQLFRVQYYAGISLTKVTGLDWGPVFNEDVKTWSAWLTSPERASFRPHAVPRTDAEVAELMEKLFHRFMSGRPNPYQRQNALAEPSGVSKIAEDLRPLGARIGTELTRLYGVHASETPVRRDELRSWTTKVLRKLDLPGAADAAARIE